MSGNADLILAGIAGGGTGNALAWIAPLGTAAPTDATTAWPTGWQDLGWCTTDGLTEKIDVETKEVEGFGASGPLRVLKSKQTETFEVGFLETSPLTQEVYYGLELGSIEVAADGSFDWTTGTPTDSRYMIGFDTVDGQNRRRVIAPLVSSQPNGDIQTQNGEEISYGVTFTAYVGSDGVAVHRFVLMDALKTTTP